MQGKKFTWLRIRYEKEYFFLLSYWILKPLKKLSWFLLRINLEWSHRNQCQGKYWSLMEAEPSASFKICLSSDIDI